MQNKLAIELEKLLDENFSDEVAVKFRQRLKEGKLTKNENPESHFCAYFAACDFKAEQLFIGHHIKSGLWLFNGGHIDGRLAKNGVSIARILKSKLQLF